MTRRLLDPLNTLGSVLFVSMASCSTPQPVGPPPSPECPPPPPDAFTAQGFSSEVVAKAFQEIQGTATFSSDPTVYRFISESSHDARIRAWLTCLRERRQGLDPVQSNWYEKLDALRERSASPEELMGFFQSNPFPGTQPGSGSSSRSTPSNARSDGRSGPTAPPPDAFWSTVVSDPTEAAKLARLLRPLTDPGRWQPWSADIELRPVSLNALRTCGALNPDSKGREMLLWVMNKKRYHYRQVEDGRARWGYPDRLSGLSPEQADNLLLVQRFLIEHGDALVDAGKLSR